MPVTICAISIGLGPYTGGSCPVWVVSANVVDQQPMRLAQRAAAVSVKTLILVAAGSLAACGDAQSPAEDAPAVAEDAPNPTCELHAEIVVFPYSNLDWLTLADIEDPLLNAESVQILDTEVPWRWVAPERVRVASQRNVWSMSMYAGEFSQGVIVVTSTAPVHGSAPAWEDSRELDAFSQLDFRDQLAWYRDHGQGPYVCRQSSSLRDLKKYHIESNLGPVGPPDALPVATIGRFGLTMSYGDWQRTVDISPSGWMVVGGWPPIDGEFERFDATELISMFEALVLEELSVDEFRAYLDDAAIAHEFDVQ